MGDRRALPAAAVHASVSAFVAGVRTHTILGFVAAFLAFLGLGVAPVTGGTGFFGATEFLALLFVAFEWRVTLAVAAALDGRAGTLGGGQVAGLGRINLPTVGSIRKAVAVFVFFARVVRYTIGELALEAWATIQGIRAVGRVGHALLLDTAFGGIRTSFGVVALVHGVIVPPGHLAVSPVAGFAGVAIAVRGTGRRRGAQDALVGGLVEVTNLTGRFLAVGIAGATRVLLADPSDASQPIWVTVCLADAKANGVTLQNIEAPIACRGRFSTPSGHQRDQQKH